MSEKTYQKVPPIINVLLRFNDLIEGPFRIGYTTDGVDGYAVIVEKNNRESANLPEIVTTNGVQRFCSETNRIAVFFNVTPADSYSPTEKQWFFSYEYDYPIHDHLKRIQLEFRGQPLNFDVLDITNESIQR